jgi:putative transcriptional regulator
MQNKIKFYRNKLDITQEQLAKKVGITRPYLSDIENNKKKPGTIIAMKIAKELNVSMEALFFANFVHHGKQNHDQTTA